MFEIIRIGNIEVTRGTKKSGFLKVAERSVSHIEVPITIISGVRPGPGLFVLAGEHGNEYAGIEACVRLSKTINPQKLGGTLIIVPIVNVPGFQSRTFLVNPFDNVNIARAWLGKPNRSSTSYIMTHSLYTNIIPYTNYILSLHGGDNCESLTPCVFLPLSGIKEVFEASKALAMVYGIKYIVEYPERNGVLVHEAAKKGIPGILTEAGGEGKVEEDAVKLHYNGVLNVMKYLGMIEGEPLKVKAKIVGRGGKSVWVTASRGGLLYSYVKVGDKVRKGELLGEIRDVCGETIEKIVSPISGTIFFKVNSLAWDPSLGWFVYHVVDTE